MQITFENVIEKVVNSRTLSRKDKLNQIRTFLKENTSNKASSDEEKEILDFLKNLKQSYTAKDREEKIKDRLPLGAV